MNDLTPETLAELRRLLSEAGPGGWIVTDTYGDNFFQVLRRGPSSDKPDLPLGDEQLAALIVALRNHAPALLAAAEDLDGVRAELADARRRVAELEKELALWRPLTPAEAEAAFNEAKAEPLSEERIAEIVRKATDPANTLTNSETAQLLADRDRWRDRAEAATPPPDVLAAAERWSKGGQSHPDAQKMARFIRRLVPAPPPPAEPHEAE